MKRRWQTAAIWTAWALLVTGLFYWRINPAGVHSPIPGTAGGVLDALNFWVALIGSVPSLQDQILAPWFGAVGLGVALVLLGRGGLRREPVLGAFLICTLGATFLIAYGRSGPGTPQIAPRYFVQSALLWATWVALVITTWVPPKRFWWVVVPVTAMAAGFNVLASQRYLPVAEKLFRERFETIRYYDKWLTLAGAPYAIHPNHAVAERYLVEAQRRGIFRLQARTSPPEPVQAPVQARSAEQAMNYYLDEVVVADRRIHVRGWLLPTGAWETGYEPYLVLKAGEREYAFRGRRQRRVDVATTFGRTDAMNAGFLFVVRRVELPPTEFTVTLELRTDKGGIFTKTDHRIDNQTNFAKASLGSMATSLVKPARQFFVGALP